MKPSGSSPSYACAGSCTVQFGVTRQKLSHRPRHVSASRPRSSTSCATPAWERRQLTARPAWPAPITIACVSSATAAPTLYLPRCDVAVLRQEWAGTRVSARSPGWERGALTDRGAERVPPACRLPPVGALPALPCRDRRAGRRGHVLRRADPVCVAEGNTDSGADLGDGIADAAAHAGDDTVRVGPGSF